jgi:chromosomal replication initiation ATPase DnaA
MDIPKGISPDVLVYLASEHRKNRRPPTLQAIMDDICHVFEVSEDYVRNARQFRKHVKLRQLFSWVSTEITDSSCVDIGIFLGQDHSTVLSHKKKVQGWIDVGDYLFIDMFNYYKSESKIWRRK